MWNQICEARDNKSPHYCDQRTNPQHLVSERNTNYFFDKTDPNDLRISKLQRYTAVTSVTDLLNEVEQAIEYVKTHSGVEIDYSHEDGEIAEVAMDSVNVAPTARADKVIQDVASNDNAAKRSYNTIVHSGHITHPSKS
jgi:hypothetical protein